MTERQSINIVIAGFRHLVNLSESLLSHLDLVLTEYVFVSPRKIDTKKKAPTKGNVS